jgi:ankyrin repeat protein
LTKQQPYRAKLDRGNDTMLTTGTTPLLRAAKAADVPAMKILLAAKADVNLATRPGITPLMAAAGMGTKEEDTTGRFKTEDEINEAIDLLLGAGANINAKGAQGQTALHAAAQWGYDKVAEHLIAKGADVNAKDRRPRRGRRIRRLRRLPPGCPRIHCGPAAEARRTGRDSGSPAPPGTVTSP